MPIPTVASLRKTRRRLDRRQLNELRVLGAMAHGASLRLTHQNGRQLWAISTGEFVSAEIALVVIKNPKVAAVDAALFAGMLAQTWRYIEDRE